MVARAARWPGGGQVNLQKAAELLIADFRSNAIGRITLETPEQFGQWLQAGLAADRERATRKQKLREGGHIRPVSAPSWTKRAAAPAKTRAPR